MISTVIITATIVALVTVAMVFANNLLTARMAESDYNAAKLLMHQVGLQIDDVAWRMGQTETVRYASRYGSVAVKNATLRYTITATIAGGQTVTVFNGSTGVAMFNMPTTQYSLSNNYFNQLWPTQLAGMTLQGSSAEITKVFEVEKIPMADGSYIRVVTAPMIRVINSSITTASNSTFFYKLYLPLVSLRSTPGLSQSVTLTGSSMAINTVSKITSIRITLSFPQFASGFDNSFFRFPSSLTQVINAPTGYNDCVLELYTGTVSVDVGTHA